MKSYTFLFVSLILMSLVFACGPIGEDSWSDLKPGDSSKDKGGNPHMPQPVDPGGPMLPTPTPTATPTPTPRPTATPTPTPTSTPTPFPSTPTPTPPPASGDCDYIIEAGESINKYSATATAGQTVCVRAGTYNETLSPANSGAAGARITFKAYSGDECQGAPGQPKIAGSCKVILDGTSRVDSGVDLHGKSYLHVEGFEIRNWSDDGVYGNNSSDPMVTDIEIVNNYIHDVGLGNLGNSNDDGSAMLATHIDTLLFENNEVFNTGDAGVSCSGPSGCRNFTIRGNNIHRTGQDGIMTNAWRPGSAYAENFLIENNVFYDSFLSGQHQDGINTHSGRNWIIRNNVVKDYTQLVYFPLGDDHNSIAEDIQIYGNVFYNERYKTVYGGDTQCIFIASGYSDSVIRNITIHSNTCGWVGYGPIWIFGTTGTVMSNIKITNNIFFDKAPEVSGGNITGLYSNYNLYFKGPVPAFEGPNSITSADPQFVNYLPPNDPSYAANRIPYDFRLQPTSPAIDQGGLGSIPAPADFADQWGNPRPSGGGYDIGAHEFVGP